VSIEEASQAVPAEQRALFIARAEQVAERARARRSSEVELELALRALSVLHGAGRPGARGRES